MTWRNSIFNVQIQEGGVGGPEIYNFGKHYGGFYNPDAARDLDRLRSEPQWLR